MIFILPNWFPINKKSVHICPTQTSSCHFTITVILLPTQQNSLLIFTEGDLNWLIVKMGLCKNP